MPLLLMKRLSRLMLLCLLGALSMANTSCHSKPAKAGSGDSTGVKSADSAAAGIPGSIIPEKEDSTKQYIFLTFDDGPQPPGTREVFDLCKQLGVKASFFMVGMHVIDDYRRSFVDSIRNAYPEFLLCNHSTTHAFQDKYKTFYNEPDSALHDFLKAQQSLQVPFKIIRLPGNSAWVRQGEVFCTRQTRPVCKLLDSAGYNVIGWDVEWDFSRDGKSLPVESAETMVKKVAYALDNHTTHTRNNVVILSHDRMFREPSGRDTLAKFISALKNNPHYVLQTIDKYPRLKTN